jgi:hypothetical protein
VQRTVRRQPALCVAALVALHLLFSLLTFEPRPHTGGDNAAYITLARSLIERGAYLELWDPAEAPHTKYPPVFPAILAVAMLLGLQPWVQLKLVVLTFSAIAVAFSFLWMRARRRHAAALAVGIIVAIAPGVLREGRWILSDVPFWAFTMVALWAFQTMRARDHARFAVAAAATILAYFTRSAGLPLLLAALAWLAWRRRWIHAAALAGAAALPALLWGMRSRAFAPADYVSEFWLVDPYYPVLGRAGPADLALRLGENAWKYASVHLPTLLTGAPSLSMLPISALILAFAAWGWFRSAAGLRAAPAAADRPARTAGVTEVFLPLYLGLILLWPSVWSGERFLLPVLPVVLFLAAGPLVRLGRRVAGGRDLVAAGGVAVLLLLAAVPGLVRGMQVGHECTRRYWAGEAYPCLGAPAWDDFFAISGRSGELLPPDAVVLNRKARLFHVLSGGLKSRPYPLVPEPGALFAAADSAGARYVILDQLDMVAEIYLRPVLIRRASAFCLVAVEAETATVLFGILPGAASVGDDSVAAEPDGTIGFPFCPAEYWLSPQVREDYMRRISERHGA